jgi:pimeloyl-ACP methyl ester carboxylesterase
MKTEQFENVVQKPVLPARLTRRMVLGGSATILIAASLTAGATDAGTALPSPQATGTRLVASINGQSVYFQDMGNSHAPTLIFIHGAGGLQSTGQVGPLLSKQYHVLIPSLPGFDETPLGDTRTLADAVEVLAKFINQVSSSPVYVVGQSLGGRVACWLGISHPNLIKKLVLSAPATLASKPPQLPDDDSAARKVLAKMLFGSEDAVEKIPASQLASQRKAIALLSDYMQAPSRDTFLARLAEISAPTLILWGKKDVVLREEDGPALFKERIRDLRVVFIDGPHALPMTNAGEYVEETLRFLREEPVPPGFHSEHPR